MHHHLNLFENNSQQDRFMTMNNRKMSEQPIKSLSKVYSESLLQIPGKSRNDKTMKSTSSQANLSRGNFIHADLNRWESQD